jgi:hypothetical protein
VGCDSSANSHRGEIHDEPAVLLEAALDHDAGPIVVAVERLAAMAGERDEMRGREDQIFLRDGDLELTAGTQTAGKSTRVE